MALTFVLVVIGWIIFRAQNIGQATAYLCAMFTNAPFGPGWLIGKRFLFYGALLLAVEWLQRDKEHALQLPSRGLLRFSAVRYALYAALVYVLMVYAGEVQTFIYFQF